MIGEQYDVAVAFCRGVLTQDQGKKNRKLMKVDKFMKLLEIDTISPLPDKVREAFTDFDVYTRKLRGRDYMAIWWDRSGSHHGRGVPKRG